MTTGKGVTEGHVNANGIRIHYTDWGNSDRPNLLLVHGWDGTAHYWDLVAPAFRDRFHVVALTLRGRGKSDEDPTGRYRFEDYRTDIWEATQQLGLQKLIFVGASLGGLIALPYAAEHSEQVEKLVQVDIGARLGPDKPSPAPPAHTTAPDQFDSLKDADVWLREQPIHANLSPEGMAIMLEQHFHQTSDGKWNWNYAHRLRAVQGAQSREVLFPTQWHLLSRVTCPALLIRCNRADSLPADVAERTRKGLPNGTVVEIQDSHHYPFLEVPDKLIKVLADFVG